MFEGVFTKRGAEACATDSDCQPTGVFEEVFVRRGRWRKDWTNSSNDSADNVHRIAEDVASELPDVEFLAPALSDMNVTKSPVLEIADAAPYVIKNTFININKKGIAYDSLEEFLDERRVQSCPAGSININDIFSSEEPKEAAWNTASTFGDIEVPFVSKCFHIADFMPDESTACEADDTESAAVTEADQVGQWMHTWPVDSHLEGLQQRIAEVIGEPAEQIAFNTASTFAGERYDDTPFGTAPEERLNDLRIRGSQVQQMLARQEMQEMQAQWEQQALLSMLPIPPPPPLETPAPSIDASLWPVMPGSIMPLPPPPPLDMAPPPVLRLADVLAPPQLGTPELPSLGSGLHHRRECRPCTFFHTRGCQNKEKCEFCHLCGPGEKKKRLRAQRLHKRQEPIAAILGAKAILAMINAAEETEEMDFIVE